MYAERHIIPVTTAADGSATVYSPPVTGRILNIVYDKIDFASGVDLAITSEITGQTIWSQEDVNASAIVAPRQPTHGTDGAAAAYADSGAPVLDHIVLADDRVKIVIASGGDAKSGTFIVIVG